MPPADQFVPAERPDELHRLLGVPADTEIALLRHAYEQQVAAALRSHDQARTLQLSTALDQLPVTVRQQLYSRVHAHPANVLRRRPGSAADWHPAVAEPEWEPACPPGPSRARAGLIRRRFWLALVAVPSLVLAVVSAIGWSNRAAPAQQLPALVRQPAAPAQGPARTVPRTAPTEPNGYVRIVCPPTAQAAGYAGYARRGQVIRCGNGAVAQLPRG